MLLLLLLLLLGHNISLRWFCVGMEGTCGLCSGNVQGAVDGEPSRGLGKQSAEDEGDDGRERADTDHDSPYRIHGSPGYLDIRGVGAESEPGPQARQDGPGHGISRDLAEGLHEKHRGHHAAPGLGRRPLGRNAGAKGIFSAQADANDSSPEPYPAVYIHGRIPFGRLRKPDGCNDDDGEF